MPNEINILFNETHPYKYKVNETTSLESLLTFVRSVNIQAFPCGRRTSAPESAPQDYYFPFDPEARLSTEANNRKHSSLNGYTQTYLKEWDNSEKLLTLSLAGYLFTVALDGTYTTTVDGNEVTSAFNYSAVADFCSAIITQLSEKADSILSSARSATIDAEEKIAAAEELLRNIESSDYIYANILLEDVHLFSGTPKEYFTSILRDQYDTTNSELAAADIGPNPLLDILNKAAEDAVNFEPKLNPDNYFFSGLSFSATPLTGVEATRSSALHHVDREHMPNDTTTQLVVSLRILEKVDEEWQIHQPAYLPKIEHGVTENSLVVGDTRVQRIEDPDTEEVVDNYNGDLTVDHDIYVGNQLISTGNITTDTLDVLTKTTTKALDVTNNAYITTADITGATIGTEVVGTSTITTAGITTATIGTADITIATIDTATIGTATITDTTTDNLTVNTKATIAEADIETADINTLTGNTATITTINSDDINQKVNGQYYDVPVMFLDKVGSEYQLKISRVNKTF